MATTKVLFDEYQIKIWSNKSYGPGEMISVNEMAYVKNSFVDLSR